MGLLSLVAWLREEARLALAVIQRDLAQLHHNPLEQSRQLLATPRA